MYKKSYQTLDFVSSIVTTKVKGQGFVPITQLLAKINNRNYNETNSELFEIKYEETSDYLSYDSSDFVYPPNEYNSIFIITNFIETKQTLGECDEVNSYENLLKSIV
jgi:hypothetical protein